MLKLQMARFSMWLVRIVTGQADATRTERPDVGIGAEAPIRKASEDRMRRVDFAGRIASILSELSPREGRVFAIRGGWGFGKSSLKNLIIEILTASSDGADWVDFNPWQWGDGDAITRALFGQMADRLGGEHSKAERDRAEALRRYGRILTGASARLKKANGSSDQILTVLTNVLVVGAASAIGFDLPTVAKVMASLAVLSVGASLLGHIFSHFGRDHSGEPLDKVREVLEGRLRKLDRPLVVFVDDIDRLEPKQIRILLRQVKANANLPNIVFVLMFQPSIVESALDPVADDDGRAFLEKIVQTNFDLPAVPVSIVHRIFAEELDDLLGSYANEANGFSNARWGNAFVGSIQPMLRNVRDARRLISSIAVHLPLHVAGDVFEVNLVDFILLESLRVFEPDIHQALFRERKLVLQEYRVQGYSNEDAKVKAAAERLLEVGSEERRVIVQKVLKNLFPPLEWAYGGTNYDDGFRVGWIADKRACTARYFPRYFELQTPAGELSEQRFVAFLDATDTEAGLAAAIAAVEADDLLQSLVARLDESFQRLPVDRAAVLLPGMFEIAQKLAGRNDFGPFDSSWYSAWSATNRFLSRIPEDERGALAIDAFCQTKALSIAAILIHLNDPVDQRPGDFSDPTLDQNTVSAMKVEWLRLIRLRATEGDTLIDERDLLSMLYRWKDYSGSLDEARNWVAGVILTDEGFAKISSRLMGKATMHTTGDSVSSSKNLFERKTIEDFIGISAAKARCDLIDPKKYPEHEEALTTLRDFLKSWLG
ncbi:KAP family P-loop NTPase fold protein [Janthinobacterium sp. DSP2-3-3]|uniref:KAP family P-loop NTPase fold protein n=1 Tax=Janthinobacterium sp. DSP2-3-3 TaxID=2804596 RepID=UPI003CF87AC1